MTSEKINTLKSILDKNIIITQGFIGQTKEGLTTTLGREGSDYSAAIFASCLDAASVTIWKDVPGVMNADPKRCKRCADACRLLGPQDKFMLGVRFEEQNG